MATRRLLLLLLLLAPQSALAHRGRMVRTLYLEPEGPQKLHLLLHMQLTGDQQRAALILLADLDRDGALSLAERARLEQSLSVRAMDGLRLLLKGKPVNLPKVEAKLKLPKKGAVELLLHGSLEVPKEAVELMLSLEPSAEPLGFAYIPAGRAARSARGQLKGGGLKTVLGPADRIVWRISAS